MARGQVVANQIAVIPPSAESDAKAVNSDLDKGMEKNVPLPRGRHAVHSTFVPFQIKHKRFLPTFLHVDSNPLYNRSVSFELTATLVTNGRLTPSALR